MSTTTVRVTEETHTALRELADETGESIRALLAKAVEAYRRQHFLEAANADYARLRADPTAWAEELEERRLWDTALLDRTNRCIGRGPPQSSASVLSSDGGVVGAGASAPPSGGAVGERSSGAGSSAAGAGASAAAKISDARCSTAPAAAS